MRPASWGFHVQERCNMDITTPPPLPSNGKPLPSDWLFIIFLIFAVLGVSWVGVLAYREGLNTETIKRHGETWGQFLVTQSTLRGQEDYPLTACSAKPEPKTTWGECYQSLVAPGGPLDDLTNPFTRAPQKLAAACNPNDRSLVGALVLEKLTPTPPGSPVPFITEALTEDDAISQKLQIRVTVCDKGASPIRVGEFEF